ncbi:MAG: hypothetical protein ABI623_07380, partial [bacterium]
PLRVIYILSTINSMQMNLTTTTVNNFGYISITIMMALLLLLWFKVVPGTFTIPFFIIALALFIARIVMRIKLARMEREAMNSTTSPQS